MSLFSALNGVVENLVEQWGYAGIVAAMVLENVIPPVPSELIMPLAGFYVGQGKLDFVLVVLSGLLGTVLGALPWYGLGRLVNEERLRRLLQRRGRWLGVSPEELDQSRIWFQRHGAAVVFWGRLIPAIRTLISVPAGIELMPFGSFLLWTTAGSLIWNLALTGAGWLLGSNWQRVLTVIKPLEGVVNGVLALALLVVVVWLGRRLWRRRGRGDRG
jgi:alkaline phosphatase